MLEEWKIFLEIEGMGIYMSIPEVEKEGAIRSKDALLAVCLIMI